MNDRQREQEKTKVTWQIVEVESNEKPEAWQVREHRLLRFAIEVTQTKCRDAGGQLLRATIELRAYLVDGEGVAAGNMGSMGGTWCNGVYTLTGGTMILPASWRGHGLGTFMQNRVVTWAKAEVGEPGAINPIRVEAGDATTAAERDRRNRFYEQFGIRFIWDAPVGGIERAKGRSDPALRIADVHPLDTVNGVRTLTLPGAFDDLTRRAKWAEQEAVLAQKARKEADCRATTERAVWVKLASIGGGVVLAVGLLGGAIIGHAIGW